MRCKRFFVCLLASPLIGCSTQIGAAPSPSASPVEAALSIPTQAPTRPEAQVKQLLPFNPEALPQDVQYPEALVKSFNQLGFRLIKILHAKQPERNIVFSPELIGSSLIQLYFMATPAVQTEILELLEISAPSLEAQYPHFAKIAFHQDLQKRNMSLRHALWLPQIPQWSDAQQQSTQSQGLEVFQADFGASNTLTAIQNWYTAESENTPLPTLTPSTLAQAPALFSNTSVFEGLWQMKYPEELTRERPFWVKPGQSVQAQMMRNYKEDNSSFVNRYIYSLVNAPDIQILRGWGQWFSFHCFLPAQHSSVTQVIETLTPESYLDMTQGQFFEKYNKVPDRDWAYEQVNVTLPLLNLDQQLDVKDMLMELGASEPEQILQLNSLFAEPTGIDKAELNTRLKLDEKGISASSTLQIAPLASSTQPVDFTANRPFFFTISGPWGDHRFDYADRIHYMGVVMDPTQP